MKKNVIYIVTALLIGLLLGFVIFDYTSSNANHEDQHIHSSDEQSMWTCSMHPQIMQSEPGDCPICGMELIPADLYAQALNPNEITLTPTAMALANIQTTRIGTGVENQENTIVLSGKIASNEKVDAVQASYFEGRIEKLHVNFTGETVRKGQLLATIYAPTLVNAQQELITTSTMKDSQPDLYQAVRNKLRLWKLTEQQINQIEASGQVKEFFPIYATVSGTVVQKMAEEGDYVSKGQPILRLSNLNSLWAIFDAYENQISNIHVGDAITVSTQAYPDHEYQAKISFIDPILDIESRTIAVRANLSNTGNRLKPGMFATGKIVQDKTPSNTDIQVPASAVMWTGERSLVYVKTHPNEPIFEMREVTIGERSGDKIYIKEGLTQGEEIVVNGTFTVDAAAQLQGKNSMMLHNPSDKTIDMRGTQRIKVSEDFRNEVEGIFEQYILLKDALVDDDAKESQSIAKTLKKTLETFDAKDLQNEKDKKSWESIFKQLKSNVSQIATTATISTQREHFITLSDVMKNVIQTFGINQPVYNLYCPMANSDKGAYWLSKDQEVLNPYFGEAMISCGEVREEIK